MKRIWKVLNAPIVILIVGAIIAGRGIIIPVIGTQPSILVTIIVIVVIFAVMSISFYAGMFFAIMTLVSVFVKKETLPFAVRMFSSMASKLASINPIFQIQVWRAKRHPQKPKSDLQVRIEKLLQESKEHGQ